MEIGGHGQGRVRQQKCGSSDAPRLAGLRVPRIMTLE
jgi:hypothetical protein